LPKQSFPHFLPFFGLFIVGTGALLYSIVADKDEKYFDSTGTVEARDLTVNVGVKSGVEVWRVRLTDSGLLVIARSPDESKFQIGDCVMVRQYSGTNLFERRIAIIGTTTGCNKRP